MRVSVAQNMPVGAPDLSRYAVWLAVGSYAAALGPIQSFIRRPTNDYVTIPDKKSEMYIYPYTVKLWMDFYILGRSHFKSYPHLFSGMGS